MIAKQTNTYITQNPYDRARYIARQRVAEQLEQAFGAQVTDVRLFHDLRFKDGVRAQHIDHLVVHPYGAILIENRSEDSSFSISNLGEWTQTFMGKRLKIPSPIEQLERKIQFLEKLLQKNAEQFLEVGSNVLEAFKIEGLVSLPLAEELEHPDILHFSELCRRQFIIERSERIIQAQAKAGKGWFGLAAGKHLKEDELYRLSAFLRSQHQTGSTTSVGTKLEEPKICPRCSSSKLYVEERGNAFELICFDCAHAEVLSQKCSRCYSRAQISRSADGYVLECPQCKAHSLLHTQPDSRTRWL